RTMARVMSLAFVVFLGVPILAPTLGAGIVALTVSWRAIFLALAAYGALVALWVVARLPESLHPEFRRALSVLGIARDFGQVVGNRVSLFYTLAMAAMFGALMGFVTSAEQVFADIFHAARWFPLVFAISAGGMALGAFTNSHIVERFGTRRVSHTALLGYLAITSTHLILAKAGFETLQGFALFQAMTMYCFSLATPNFGAMAMEELGHIAGSASSVQGFITSLLGGALLGLLIGQLYNDSVIPIVGGFAVLGVAALVCVLLAERGRLFRPHNLPVPQ
ncbi:MAG: MFS transporter, partial [Alphaproteobacteria bacterium]|nr:MFS transporter [Alphaproteobacteria bacterium]